MQEEFIRFLQSPDRAHYLGLRAKVIASDAYQPYSDELQTAGELYEQQKVQDALSVIRNAMGNLLLSPRAHQMLGFLQHKLGNDQAAEMELMIEQACLAGIQATGDGSANKPYIVLRTSDEHDLTEHLGKQLEQQSLHHEGTAHLDLIECTDGTRFWFDITDAYNRLSQTMRM